MTHTWNSDPCCSALKLSLRDSNPARNKKLAGVHATQAQLDAAKCRKGHTPILPSTDRPETLRVTLNIPVAVESCITHWLSSLMAHVSQLSGVSLAAQDGEHGLDFGKWQPLCDFEGQWTGKVVIQCQDAQDIYKIRDVTQFQGIAIERHLSTLSLSSDFVSLNDSL